MSVTKRNRNKKVFYEVSVYVQGARLAYKCFEKKIEAYIWQVKEKERLSINPHSLKKKRDKRTLLEVFELYRKERISLCALSTQQSFHGRYIYFSESPLAKLKVSSLTAEHIDMWIEWLKKHPRINHLKRKNFLWELRYLSAMLNWYHHFKDFSFITPIVKRHKIKCFYKAVPSRRPDYFMRPEEVRNWIDYLKSRKSANPAIWRLASFMILTGVRAGEACGLKWDAVDLEKGTATIFRKAGWDQKTKRPYLEEKVKTRESSRILVLSKETVKMLKEIKSERPDHGFVFSDKKGNMMTYGSIQAAFTRGFKALRLPWRATHICRHTYATMALYATRDLSSVQASLGHASQKMTEKYAKVVKMISSDTAEKTASIFKLFDKTKNHGSITDKSPYA